MPRVPPRSVLVLLLGLAWCCWRVPAAGVEADPGAAPLALPPAPAALERLMEAEADGPRAARRRIAHGRWPGLDPATLPAEEAAALLRAAGVRPDAWPAAVRSDAGNRVPAAAAWREHGRPLAALAHLGEEDPAERPPAERLLRAGCLFEVGRHGDAAGVLAALLDDPPQDPRIHAEALLLADRLGVAGPRATRRASALLDEATERAPLEAGPRRVQAQLLFDRDNRGGGGSALEAALARDPLDAASLRLLGEVALDGFDFDRVNAVVARLRGLTQRLGGGAPGAGRGHPFADALEARALLRADDPAGALAVIAAAGGERIDLLPLRAAAEAILDPASPAAAAALAACESAAPGGAAAYAVLGEVLSEARRYPASVAALREAIRRLPSDPGPHHTLGMTLAQQGDLPAAVAALRESVRLDPFQSDAANSLDLFERMLAWPVIETAHFRIRHAPGPDAVLAADMGRALEPMRADVTGFFDHEPARPTQIDLLPDAPSFAVRITGRPEIWTIAACTGDVIAMTPPRLGPEQAGAFHWLNVLRHEYAHTVTLDRTGNRIAHWLTEAAAVNAESVGRPYDQAKLLAAALRADALFAYEDLNWGFIRPEKPTDRPLAYAQSAWMLEHLMEVDGRPAMLRMLDAAARGAGDAEALRASTGLGPEAFLARFRPWAEAAVARWGLDKAPPEGEAAAAIGAARSAADPAAAAAARGALAALPAAEARHPDVLEAVARLEAAFGNPAAAEAAVERYALARPVDPWPQTALADLALAAGNADLAAAHLSVLERSDGMTARSARLLMELYSRDDRPAAALAAAQAALLRQPYDAGLREDAAALALRAGEPAEALFQVEQLVRLEPDEPLHRRRLEAVRNRVETSGG
ncbi:peptidase MA family metallohydrolase [Phycisphaera mikurensis]|uniref:Peptidase MA-like domain-containing protein n=1 Tax=Phycisphaera mikurensis (strain NBRC 102666 / KCTC 22515 / FYK2301M01) TaxID=1142394 RepID=I0IDU1_PHYMF|nr:hypothetical protein [Phycisphaera mikurensis]MBB6441240.1 tetratricopeptide (TPR) repeat protein [Phycisphaera mikurensis]BAM03429.1 hypothetical protein PSMK_12700 [Phycisphaera mikurensis NBRC 102666]